MKVPLQKIVLLGALALSGHCAAQPPKTVTPARYTVTDIGTLGGATSEAFGLNGSGQVVGRSETATGQPHAFLYSPGGFVLRANGAYLPRLHGKPALLDLTPAEAARSEARAINSFGVVVGTIATPKETQAFIWNGFSAQTLGPNGANAITDTWQIGGVNALWQARPDKPRTLASFAGDTPATVYGLSEAGDAVGAELFDATHGTTRPFLRHGDKIETLAQPFSKAAPAAAYAINNKGQIVGTNGRQAFLWQDGKLTHLDPTGRFSVAYAINAQGQIVGQADVSLRDQSLRAVLWDGGNRIDLNTRIAPHSGWTLEEARGINQSGQICGTGTFGGRRHAFLLTPQSP